MTNLLLISDDPRRGERLARDLGERWTCRVHDLHGDTSPEGRADLIVSDVARLDSDALVRLRRCLAASRGADAPLLFLTHGNAARAEAQARLLGATETLGFAATAHLFGERLAQLSAGSGSASTPVSAIAAARARQAGRFLGEAFFAGVAVTPAIAEAGTDVVGRAVREVGIRDWVLAVQRFDEVTHRHILLVAGLAVTFAGALGLNALDRHRLAKAALLHDVGKTRIPPTILNKPSQLDDAEIQVMRTHATLGHAMLARAGFDPETLAVARSHHEMLDGSGYPDGLRGGQIPDLVRLVTVCDVYAALIERRPYKTAMPGAEAFAVLAGMAGRLDGDLVHAFRPVAAAFDPAVMGAAA